MKKNIVFIFLITACLCLFAGCSKADDRHIVDPDGNKAVTGQASPIPSSMPSATPTPSLTPSPTPSPTPTPTPMPELTDLLTETDDQCLYTAAIPSFSGYYFQARSFCDSLIYFGNETKDSLPQVISYNIGTGETYTISVNVEDIDDYAFYVIPDKYIVIKEDSYNIKFYDESLKELFSFTVPYEDANPDDNGDEEPNDDYSDYGDSEFFYFLPNKDYTKIYYIKGTGLYECSTETGTETLLIDDPRLSDAYISCLTPDENYMYVSMYTRKYAYYRLYLFDMASKEFCTTEGEASDISVFVSPDKKQLITGTALPLSLKVTSNLENPEEILNDIYLSNSYPENSDAVEIKISNLTEIYNPIIDWERKRIITRDSLHRNDYSMITYTCYDMTTGDPVSNCVISYENPSFQDDAFVLDAKRGLLYISGSVLKDPYFYVWDYMNDDLNVSSSKYIRFDSIPEFVDTYRKELEEKYNIYIYLGTEIFGGNHDYEFAFSDDYSKQEEVLHMIDEVFSMYPENIFSQLRFDGKKTLGIYLCAGFTKKSSYGIDNAVALAGTDSYERFLALDVSYWGDLRMNIIHELSHLLDTKIDYTGESTGEFNFVEVWNENNPKDFYYMNDYNKSSPFAKFTYYDGNREDCYFIDTYSLSKATEDRARLFENLMRYEGKDFFASEHMRTKLHTYFDYIRKCYDTTDWPEETIWENKLRLLDLYYSGDKTVTLQDIYPEYYNGDAVYSFSNEIGYINAYSYVGVG